MKVLINKKIGVGKMTTQQRINMNISKEIVIEKLTTELYGKSPEEMTLKEWNDLLERVNNIGEVEK